MWNVARSTFIATRLAGSGVCSSALNSAHRRKPYEGESGEEQAMYGAGQ